MKTELANTTTEHLFSLKELQFQDIVLLLENFANYDSDESDESPLIVKTHYPPDTDGIVSSLFMAIYLHLTLEKKNVLIRIGLMPPETRELLGDLISDLLLQINEVASAIPDNDAKIVLVDCHSPLTGNEILIDHHPISSTQKFPEGVEIIYKDYGACSTIIYELLTQAGYTLDKKLFYILVGAVMMDTDGSLGSKAKPADLVIIKIAEILGIDTLELYRTLSLKMLDCDDLYLAMFRDGKIYDIDGVDGDIDGVDGDVRVSCLWIKSFYDLDLQFEQILSHAHSNNTLYRFPLTIVKVAKYDETAIVLRETIFFISEQTFPSAAILTLKNIVKQVLLVYYPELDDIFPSFETIRYSLIGCQISRKKLMPLFQKVIAYFLANPASKELDVNCVLAKDDKALLTVNKLQYSVSDFYLER